jgi:hypothetical protein
MSRFTNMTKSLSETAVRYLLVHGLRGEYYPYFRWQKVAEKLAKSEVFSSKYKIYLVRYSSLDRFDQVLPKFKDALTSLYSATKQRPITMMALSMGGNIAYESLTDPNIESKVRLLFTMGTPFHGSPLFCKDWMNYTVYKRLSWPWTRIDHNLSYRFYFDRNPILRQDLAWDNADEAIPETGKFKSRLPFGPKGTLTVGDTINSRLTRVNSVPVDRKKANHLRRLHCEPLLSSGFQTIRRDRSVLSNVSAVQFFSRSLWPRASRFRISQSRHHQHSSIEKNR